MVTTPTKTMEVVKEKTHLFLHLHWNTEALENIEFEKEWKKYRFRGAVPHGDKQGCYALVNNREVIYIGLGASRGWGIYKGHGIGARLNSHVLLWDKQIKADITNRVYKPREKWKGITEIFTFGFP